MAKGTPPLFLALGPAERLWRLAIARQQGKPVPIEDVDAALGELLEGVDRIHRELPTAARLLEAAAGAPSAQGGRP